MPTLYTAAGWPAASSASLRELAGKPGIAKRVLEEKYGVIAGYDNSDVLESAILIEDGEEEGGED